MVKNADKGFQKFVPLGKISDSYAFTWSYLVKNTKKLLSLSIRGNALLLDDGQEGGLNILMPNARLRA